MLGWLHLLQPRSNLIKNSLAGGGGGFTIDFIPPHSTAGAAILAEYISTLLFHQKPRIFYQRAASLTAVQSRPLAAIRCIRYGTVQ